MVVLGGVLLTLFVIVSILLVLVVMLQDDQGEGLGGIFGGNSNSSIGLQTGNILTKFTAVLATLFIILSLSLMMVYTKTGRATDNVTALTEESAQTATWYKDIAEPVAPVSEEVKTEESAETTK